MRDPKQDLVLKYWRSVQNTLSEIKTQKLFPYARQRASPSLFLEKCLR